MTSSQNKRFLNTGPPSSPGEDVSLLKQMIHPSEGSFFRSFFVLPVLWPVPHKMSCKHEHQFMLQACDLSSPSFLLNQQISPYNSNWDTHFFLNGKYFKLKKYFALFSLIGISNGCLTSDFQVLLQRRRAFSLGRKMGRGLCGLTSESYV